MKPVCGDPEWEESITIRMHPDFNPIAGLKPIGLGRQFNATSFVIILVIIILVIISSP
jgi:hypothetical protein